MRRKENSDCAKAIGQKEAEVELEFDFQNENDLRIGEAREGRLLTTPLRF
jgi:hypothetical protein